MKANANCYGSCHHKYSFVNTVTHHSVLSVEICSFEDARICQLYFSSTCNIEKHSILPSFIKENKVSYFLQVCALTSVHNHTYNGSLLLLHINFMYIPLNIALKVKIIDGVHRASETLFLERLFVLVTKALLGFAISFFSDPLSRVNEMPFFSISLGWQQKSQQQKFKKRQ